MTEAKKVEIKNDELPEGWVVSTLGDISSYIQRGKSPKYTEFSKLPVVNQKCVRWNGIDREYVKYIHPDQFEKWEEKRFLKEGDLLWNSTGTGTIGRVAIAQLNDKEKLVVDSHVTIVRSGKCVEPKYVHYWVMSPVVQNSIVAMQSGSTNQVELSKGAVESTPIPVAPPEQQKRIVAKIEELFSHIDVGIEALKKTKQLLKQYRQSVLKTAITGELTKEWREANKDKLEPASQLLERILIERRQLWEEQQLEQFKVKGKMPKDDKWKEKYIGPEAYENGGYEIPDSWVMARAEQVCEFITKGTTPKKDKLSAGNGDVPFIKVYNLTFHAVLNFDINPTFTDIDIHNGFLARSKVFPGDVLMNIVGPPLGKVSIVPKTHNEWNINQAIAIYRPITGLNNKLLAYLLLSKPVVEWMLSKTKTTAGQINLTLEISRNAPIPIMPIDEQLEIVRQVEEKLASSDRLLEELNIQQIKAKKNKQSILVSSFSGEL